MANPGKDLAALLLTVGCFLDPGSLWQNPQPSSCNAQYTAQAARRTLRTNGLVEQADLAEFFFEIRGQDALIGLYTQTVAADQKSLDLHASTIRYRHRRPTFSGRGTQYPAVGPGLIDQPGNFTGTVRARDCRPVGKPASGFSIPSATILTAPPPIPIGMPSLLLQRRPDVAAAERTMAAANAELGVAYTAFFPTLTLSASGGFESSCSSICSTGPAAFGRLVPSFSQPIFNAALSAELHQYVAIYNANVASYRQTVLTAFQQVED